MDLKEKYRSWNTWNTYMFKVNNKNTRTRCEICSKLTLKISERRQCLPPPPILHENLDPPFYDFSKTPTPLQVWRFHTINNPRPIVFIMAHQMCQKHFFQQFINQSLICIKTIIAFHSAYSNKEWKFCTNENIYKLWLKMEVTVRTSVKTELFHLKIQTFMSFLT